MAGFAGTPAIFETLWLAPAFLFVLACLVCSRLGEVAGTRACYLCRSYAGLSLNGNELGLKGGILKALFFLSEFVRRSSSDLAWHDRHSSQRHLHQCAQNPAVSQQSRVFYSIKVFLQTGALSLSRFSLEFGVAFVVSTMTICIISTNTINILALPWPSAIQRHF